MSASKIPATERYFLPGVTKVIIVPVVADLAVGCTRVELDAGSDISDEIASISGWMISSAAFATPDLGKRFTPSIDGRLTADASSLTTWADKAGEDIREVLAVDVKTHVVFLDGGDVPGSPMCVYKVSVSSLARMREIEGGGRIDSRFSIRDYNEDLVVPALA